MYYHTCDERDHELLASEMVTRFCYLGTCEFCMSSSTIMQESTVPPTGTEDLFFFFQIHRVVHRFCLLVSLLPNFPDSNPPYCLKRCEMGNFAFFVKKNLENHLKPRHCIGLLCTYSTSTYSYMKRERVKKSKHVMSCVLLFTRASPITCEWENNIVRCTIFLFVQIFLVWSSTCSRTYLST